MSKRSAPVVIVRKHKRLGFGHVIAFALTGGASAGITAVKAATNAGYNARTDAMQASRLLGTREHALLREASAYE